MTRITWKLVNFLLFLSFGIAFSRNACSAILVACFKFMSVIFTIKKIFWHVIWQLQLTLISLVNIHSTAITHVTGLSFWWAHVYTFQKHIVNPKPLFTRFFEINFFQVTLESRSVQQPWEAIYSCSSNFSFNWLLTYTKVKKRHRKLYKCSKIK